MFQRYGLYFAWLLACLGTLGSLYFSNIKNLEPCHLCWYQRISLFPLAIILGIAAYRLDFSAIRYALPICLLGLVFALYQVGVQQIPGWNPIEMCGAGPSCSEKQYIGLGPITIPMLSTINFIFITALLAKGWLYCAGPSSSPGP